jgi:uncharacterized protein (TIGR02300 family)
VVKPELGTKRICPNCGARYYDLHRDPVTCPKCGSAFDPETVLKSRRARPAPPPEVPIEPVADEEIDTTIVPDEVEVEAEAEEIPIEGAEEAETEEGEEEEEEEVIEDASELGEDEDDMAEVIENVEDEEER